MAITIKHTPVLRDQDALRFMKKANEAFRGRKPIDFSIEINTANKILTKSKIK